MANISDGHELSPDKCVAGWRWAYS